MGEVNVTKIVENPFNHSARPIAPDKREADTIAKTATGCLRQLQAQSSYVLKNHRVTTNPFAKLGKPTTAAKLALGTPVPVSRTIPNPSTAEKASAAFPTHLPTFPTAPGLSSKRVSMGPIASA